MKHYWINIDECIVRKEFVELQERDKLKLKICNPKLCFSLSLIYLNRLTNE